MAATLLFSLGRWQLTRMHEKQALLDAFATGGAQSLPLSSIVAEPAEAIARYQQVNVAGSYDTDHQFLLDNMTHEGRAGYRVLTPLATVSGSLVLVDRGWVPGGATRTQLPDVRVAGGLRQVHGRLAELPRAGIDLHAAATNGPWPRVFSYPKMGELSHALGRHLFPRIILLDPKEADGYVRDWRPDGFPPERHLGYAITWFALAATAIAIYLITQLRASTERK